MRDGGGLQVAVQESGACRRLPRVRPRRDERAIGFAHSALVDERTERRVVERAKDPRDVLQRRTLSPPLGERPIAIAVEVDEHEVLTGVEHLPEVEIAVAPDANTAPRLMEEWLEALEELRLVRDDGARGNVGARRQAPDVRSQLANHLARDVAQRLILRPAIERRVRLRGERRVLGIRRERDVKLRGPTPEERRQIGVGPHELSQARRGLEHREQMHAGRIGDGG